MAKRLIFCSCLTLIVPLASLDGWALEARATNHRSVAENNIKQTQVSKTNARSATIPDASVERSATELVRVHLPELQPVLDHLRSNHLRQYNLAIRDLAKSARRLEASKNRDSKLYDIEVELLQAQSSVRLLTAKLKVRDSQTDRRLLREAAGRLQQAELSRAQYDVRVIKERIERMQKSLDSANQRLATRRDNYQQQVAASYLGFLRKAGRKLDSEAITKKK